ncbi:MAG: glycosyltransferase [Phycisphaerales bacterium]|jgi:glycosyltransferase involved in cell wall biosynthesis
MSDTPAITVIIPSKNDHERLAGCLAALRAQSLDASQFEIIVADNGSDPSLESLAEEHGARYVLEPEGGSYAARNAALRLARGEIIAFTDSDCIPAEDWLELGLAALASRDGRVDLPDLIAGRMEVFARDADAPTAAEIYEMLFAFPQQAYVHGDSFGVTANLFVRSKVFEAVGGFEDGLHSGGDREFGRRAVRAGFNLNYDSACVVWHPARHSIEQLYKKLDRVIGGLTDSELTGTRGARLAEQRAKHALRPPIGQWRKVWRRKDASFKLRLATCVLIARLRWRTAALYREAARSLASPAPTPPPRPEGRSSAG